MENLQTIWTSIVVNNITLSNILSLFFSSIEVYLYILISSTLSDTVVSCKRKLIYLISLVILGAVGQGFIPSPYYSFVNLSFMLLFSIVVLKISILKSIAATVCFYLISFFFGIIYLGVYTFIFGCSADGFQNVLIYKIVFSLSIDLVLYASYLIFKKFNITLNFMDGLKQHSLLLFNLLLGFSTVILQLLIAYLYFDHIPLVLNILSSIFLLLYFSISLYSLYRTKKLEVTTQLLEAEKLYNKNLSALHDNIRGFKHDFNNIVQAIGGYISTNNMEALKVYYKDLVADCQTNNNLSVLNPELINNPVIYSLLTDKYYKSMKYDVKIDFTILDDLSCLNIRPYELSRILGILLDNAIEASSKSKEKIVHVIFTRDKNIDRKLIIIQNTYENKDINIDKIFEKGYTSKSNTDKSSHGLGLWEIKKYLKKRNNLSLHTTKNDTYFTQQFEIYNK